MVRWIQPCYSGLCALVSHWDGYCCKYFLCKRLIEKSNSQIHVSNTGKQAYCKDISKFLTFKSFQPLKGALMWSPFVIPGVIHMEKWFELLTKTVKGIKRCILWKCWIAQFHYSSWICHAASSLIYITILMSHNSLQGQSSSCNHILWRLCWTGYSSTPLADSDGWYR